jgi:hypothetical protein
MTHFRVATVLAFLVTPGLLIAQGGMPLGPEFRVNSYTTSQQFRPSMAFDANGNFVVVWDSISGDGDRGGIFAQRYTSAGVPLGGQYGVNTYTTGHQFDPAVGSDSAGNFVVAWSSDTEIGSLQDVFAQRYSPILLVELQSFRVE